MSFGRRRPLYNLSNTSELEPCPSQQSSQASQAKPTLLPGPMPLRSLVAASSDGGFFVMEPALLDHNSGN